MSAADPLEQLVKQVQAAAAAGAPLRIRGGGGKAFFGRAIAGEPLDVGSYASIVNYESTELVITARAGTRLDEIEAALAERDQMLAFEPPRFGGTATLGGTVACGLSGPRRPYAGAVRDYMLGVRCLNGRGEILRFGGEVMKNVAGYDVARLMAGALGTLGVLLEVSLKVLPRPACEVALAVEMSEAEAIARMNAWAGEALPISGACFDGQRLHIRLSGTEAGVQAAGKRLGLSPDPAGLAFWEMLREQQLEFFQSGAVLWRLSVPATAPPLELPGRQFIDWGGAQRWWISDAAPDVIRSAAARAGGYAVRYRGGDRENGVFHPLPQALHRLHQRLKDAFDPQRIFNRGILYPDL
jgi:glycolate oxidase FAD binding subunit